MTNTELKLRTNDFAHSCVKLCSQLPDNTLCKNIKSQLIRSSLSVAVNYRAACLSQSKNEFAAKISIVLEEADECNYWLGFIDDEKLTESEILLPLKKESEELTKIFAASRITVRKNNNKMNNN